MAGVRFDPVRVGHPSSLSHECEAALELITAGQRERPIDAVRRQLEELVNDCGIARVDGSDCSEAPHQRLRRSSRRRRYYASASMLRELYRQCAKRSRCAKDQNRLTAPNT